MTLSVSDRIASVKAGGLSASCVGVISIGCEILNHWVTSQAWSPSFVFYISSEQELGTLIFAIISGFLLGVTYRYIRRDDPNPHLRTGAIAAFGLIRGFAQLDTGFLLQGNLGQMALLAGESMVMMTVAVLGLDWAIQNNWIQCAVTQ